MGVAGLAFFGWFAIRPRAVARSQMESYTRLWGPLVKRWPRLGPFFLMRTDDEDQPDVAVKREWVSLARLVGIFGVVVALILIAAGVGKLV
jgi:hypothetical protein